MTRSTTSIAPNRRKQFLVGGVAMLAVVVTLMSALVLGRGPATAANDPSPTPVPTPVVTPEPSAPESPSEEPSPTASPTPVPTQPQQPQAPVPAPSQPASPEPVVEDQKDVLAPGGVVRVIVDAIKLRETPSTDGTIRGAVERGDLLEISYTFVADGFGPVEADGFVWYPVRPLGTSVMPELGTRIEYTQTHWMAVGNGSELWVERMAPRCVEGDPDLATLETMFAMEYVACFGERQITVEGVYGCGGCGGSLPGTFEPYWLASPMQYGFLSVDPQEQFGPFLLHFAPGELEETPHAGAIVRVTGHFNDARSSECVITPDNATHETDPVVQDLFCRKNFVVDSFEIIGMDEDFPFS